MWRHRKLVKVKLVLVNAFHIIKNAQKVSSRVEEQPINTGKTFKIIIYSKCSLMKILCYSQPYAIIWWRVRNKWKHDELGGWCWKWAITFKWKEWCSSKNVQNVKWSEPWIKVFSCIKENQPFVIKYLKYLLRNFNQMLAKIAFIFDLIEKKIIFFGLLMFLFIHLFTVG